MGWGWRKHIFVEKSYSCFQLHCVPQHAYCTLYIGPICYKDLNDFLYFIQLHVLLHCYIVKIKLVSLGTYSLMEIMACGINIRNRVSQGLIVTDGMLCLEAWLDKS